jgi:hypothetical protein
VIEEAATERTSRLLAQALADGALVLQVDVPALGLAGGVLEGEGKDGVALLHGILAVGLAGIKGLVDLVEGGGGGELVWIWRQLSENRVRKAMSCSRNCMLA